MTYALNNNMLRIMNVTYTCLAHVTEDGLVVLRLVPSKLKNNNKLNQVTINNIDTLIRYIFFYIKII